MNIYPLKRIKFKKWILLFSILSAFITFSKYVDAGGLACESLFNNYNFRISLSSSWGTELISPDHPTWKDPEYIKMITELASPAITNYEGRAQYLYTSYKKLFNKLTNGETEPLAFTSNGTQANNLSIETLNDLARERFSQDSNIKVEFLHFENMYGGSYGKSLELKRNEETTIPSPYIIISDLNDKDKINTTIQKEEEAIAFIEEKVSSKTIAISAIFIEPISASRIDGGLVRIVVYRQEFIDKLVSISKKYNIPIVADEILTGGGRTGNFWGYQYYKNFEPELITFGKGIAISGLAVNYKSANKNLVYSIYNKIKLQYSGPTTEVNPLALAQSYWVLKNIDELDLVSKANENGKYFIAKAKEALDKQISQSANPSRYDKVYIEGMGMLISIKGIFKNSRFLKDHGFANRILPPISLTKFQIDTIFYNESVLEFNPW